MQKKPIIIISVLCVISLGLGYLSGLKEEDSISNGDAETDSKKEPEFLKEGLVAYYPFNGNAKDESGNGHDGIVAGPVLSADRGNRELSAYFFDGTDDLITADNVMLSANYAISMWFKSDEQSGNRTLLSTSDNYPDTYASIFFRCEGGNEWDGFFRFNNRNVASQSGGTDILSKNLNHYGKWHHAVCIKKSDKIQLYIDGTIIDEKLDAGGKDKKTSLRIGCNMNNWFYHGLIDDLRIYNRALSAEEVKALYEFEKPQIIPETLKEGLVAYYPFNGNAKDESGNGNDGILKGAKPEFVIQPSVGNGFKITRDSWVEIPHSEAINPKGSRTISFFFQGDEEGRIFSNRHEQIARNWDFSFNYENGLIGAAFFENFSRSIRLGVQLPDLKNIYHYTITLDTLTGSFRAYINGEMTAQHLGENDLIGFSNSQGVVPLEIGREAAYPSTVIDAGFISALRFYDRALSADEVKALYEFEKAE